jgi:hypothetical protein
MGKIGRTTDGKRLPNLLIIGAMKSGTTGLYMDLASHPRFFLGHDKEPHCLCSDEVLTPEGASRYAAIYAKASPDQICCDASTGYAKRPDFEGVVQRAVQVLPENFKVIYVVRHPIDRIVSQHHHEHYERRVSLSIDDEVRRLPRYIQYSRYAYQLEPWLEALGPNRIHVVRFEDYVERRQETARELCEFLDLPPDDCLVDDARIHNQSVGKPVKNRFWLAIQRNALYRRLIRPLFSPQARISIRRLLFTKAPDAALPPPRPDTIEYLRAELSEDVERLRIILGHEEPLWSDFALTAIR